MKATATISALLLAFPVTFAAAQATAPKVFLADYQPTISGGGGGLVAGKFTEGLTGNLGGRTTDLHLMREAVVPRDRAAGAFGGLGTEASHLAAARNHLKVGKGLLQTGRFEEAMEELKQSLQRYEANLAFLKDAGELIDVHLSRAAAAFQAGYEDDGEAALAQALMMDPDLQVTGRGFPPLFERLAKKFKRRFARRRRGLLKITSDPSAATVFVDGREVGKTPLEMDDLIPGTHYLRLVRPMSGVWAQKMQAPKGGATIVLPVKLPLIGDEAKSAEDQGAADQTVKQSAAELAAQLAIGVADANLKDRAYELGLRVGADWVVVGQVTPHHATYGVRTMLLRVETRKMADLGITHMDPELLELGVRVHEVGEQIVKAIKDFPEGALVPDVAVVAAVAPAAVAPPPPPPPPPPLAAAPVVAPPPASPPPLAPSPAPAYVPVEPLTQAPPPMVAQSPPVEQPQAAPRWPVPPNVAHRSDEDRWYKRGWVWATVGVLAVGGTVAAIVLLLEPNEPPPEITVEAQWQEQRQ